MSCYACHVGLQSESSHLMYHIFLLHGKFCQLFCPVHLEACKTTSIKRY